MGRTFYAKNTPGSGGSGTSEGDPFLRDDIINGGTGPSTLCLAVNLPDDICYFLGGDGEYVFSGGSVSDPAYIAPSGSGTSGHPITFMPKPGHRVTLRGTDGHWALVGNRRSASAFAHYVKIQGFDIAFDDGRFRSSGIDINGDSTSNRAAGCEVLYNTIVGGHIASPPLTTFEAQDNYQGIYANFCDSPIVRFNDVSGFETTHNYNCCACKSYYSIDGYFADNWFHSNRNGLFLKGQTNGHLVENNLIRGNSNRDFTGNEYDLCYGWEMRNNVLGNVRLSQFSQLVSYHHNLVQYTRFFDRTKAEIYRGTVVSSTTTTATLDSGSSSANNAYRFATIAFGDGQWANVVSSVGSTRTVTFDTPIAAPVPAGTSFVVGKQTFGIDCHSNILQCPGSTCNPIDSQFNPYPNDSLWPALLTGMDHNFYVSDLDVQPTTTYLFQGSNKTFTDMTSLGWESGSQRLATRATLFTDLTSFDIQSAYLTGGRAGTRPGPANTALILDTTRYGAAALTPDTPAGLPRRLVISLAGGTLAIGSSV